MAEAFLKEVCGSFFEVHSAGLEPGTLNSLVVKVMREVGIDISKNQTKSVQQMLQNGIRFSHVVTVCDEASAERCPVFPGGGIRSHWSFRDPSSLSGAYEARLSATRAIRDAIRARVEKWCEESCVSAKNA